MTSNMEKWGRDAARKRYGSGGPSMVKSFEDGGRVKGEDRNLPPKSVTETAFGSPKTSDMPKGPQDTYAPPSEEDRKRVKELSEDK